MTGLATEQIEEILDGLRMGLTITVGGSRAHSVIGRDAKGWYREDFDEGALQRQALDEAVVRTLIVDTPDAALGVLRTLRWRELRQAMACDALPEARQALARWRALGDPMQDGPVLHAWLHPEEAIDTATQALIAAKFRSGTAWHLFMETVAWSHEPGVGRRGAAFVTALLARLEDAPAQALQLRDTFLSMEDEGRDDAPALPAAPNLPEAQP